MDKSAVVLVSSSVARDNVTRAARSLGWKVIMEEDGGDGYKLNLTKWHKYKTGKAVYDDMSGESMNVLCYFTFATTYYAIRAEKMLKDSYSFKMVPVPPDQ